MASSSSRIQEAEKHITDAEKSLKTSLLKWSPDYGNAANSYDKAAICFRNSRDHKRAKEAYTKAADCHYQNNAIYHAGKSIEQAANVARDAKDLEESASLYQRASEFYNESGHPDTAGQILLKGAQLLQHENPALAARYFLATADYYELDEKYREASNSIKNAVRMYCRTRPRQYDKIVETVQLSKKAFLRAGAINLAHEAVAVEILAMLMQGQGLDSVDVLLEANNVPEFSGSQDRDMLDQLIDAVNQNDEETIAKCCDSGVFRSMDPEYAKLARDLKLGGDSIDPEQSKSTKTPAKSPSKSSPAAVKKTPTQLADMRSQLFTKSTGEKVSSKMPKPRNAYKSTKPEDTNPEPHTSVPEPCTSVPEPRSLEEDPPLAPVGGGTEPENDEVGGDSEDEPIDFN